MSSYVDEILKAGDDFLGNFWELDIEGFSEAKFRIESSSLPFTTFTTETLPNGEKYFTDYELVGDFSITIRERKDLKVLDFFKEWEEGFFKDGVFITQKDVKAGSSQDKAHRNFFFNLIEHKSSGASNFSVNKQEIIESQSKKLSVPQKEITEGFLGNKLRGITSTIARVDSFLKKEKASNKVPTPKHKTQQVEVGLLKSTRYSKKTKIKKTKIGEHNKSDEQVLRTFTYSMVKYLGIEPVAWDYESGEPTKYSISFTCDDIN